VISPPTKQKIPFEVIDGPFITPDYISKPRGVISPLPGYSKEQVPEIINSIDKITPELSSYHKTLTYEPRPRPIPHAFESGKYTKSVEVYKEHILEFFKYVTIVDTVITFQRKSRSGYPFFQLGTEASKAEAVKLTLDQVLTGKFWNGYVILNKRLQAEIRTKLREYYFIDEKGHITLKEVGETYRAVPKLDGFLGSRIRLVFNYPLENLLKQVADTLIHNGIMKIPMFHHQMTVKPPKLRKAKIFVDTKYFERHVGALLLVRSEFIGEGYHALQTHLRSCPFLVPTDNFNTCYTIGVKDGYEVQLGSGDSAVAPIAKEFIATILLAYCKKKNLEFDKLLKHELPEFAVYDYGDDIIITSDDPDWSIDVYQFMAQFLQLEIEEPPRFLGYEYNDQQDDFKLAERSYVNNFYRPENAPLSALREYFFLGYFQRIAEYRKHGNQQVQDFIDVEQDMLNKYRKLSEYEDRRLSDIAKLGNTSLPTNYVLGKYYLLTEEEKVRLGIADALDDATKRTAIRYLFKGTQIPNFNLGE